jgi:hypothetical protein
MTLSILFDPQRAARLVEYSARAHTPSLGEVIDAALAVNRPPGHSSAGGQGIGAEIQAAIYGRTVEALLTLAADPKSSLEVRAITHAKLEDIKRRSDPNSPLDAYLIHRIRQLQSDPEKFAVAKPIDVPPGMPIGDDED